jgi:hypothetical protein
MRFLRAGSSPVSDKLFDIDFASSVSDEITVPLGKRIFPAAYLAAVAVAQIGWLWLIARIAIYFIRRFLQ